tara:strand:- start:42 stop:299 length:258 start_codon:yes stop_codon:yes gene_type:complete
MVGKMPRYRYKCDHCHREWWEWMSIKDPQPQECPHCEQGTPFKVITKFAIISKEEPDKKTAKENVVDHIEENRQILKQMKSEATK